MSDNLTHKPKKNARIGINTYYRVKDMAVKKAKERGMRLNQYIEWLIENDEPQEGSASEYFKDSKITSPVYCAVKCESYEFKPTGNGVGFFFSNSEEVARSYSPVGKTHEVYLNIKNPLVINAKGSVWSNLPEPEGYDWQVEFTTWTAAEWAQKNGYDGVIIKNVKDIGTLSPVSNSLATTYAVFASNQIKLTNNTNPTSDPDIRK